MTQIRSRQSILTAVLMVAVGVGGGASRVEAAGLYRAKPGPYAVGVSEVRLRNAAEQRDVTFRVTYPKLKGGRSRSFPLVVYSHGAFCDPALFGAVTDHWVTYGYVVVFPHHLDSPSERSKADPSQLQRLIAARLADMAFAIDSLRDLEAQAGIAGRIDAARIAVAGHSAGGLIAEYKLGLPLRAPDGTRLQFGDPRIRAGVIMSGVGLLPDMPDDAFDALTKPLIATTGTKDIAATGPGPPHPWEFRLAPFTLAPPGDKFGLVIADLDHYRGGLICNADRPGPPDQLGAAIERTVTLAFLDAYLKDDPKARKFLASADLDRASRFRARLERK